MRKPRGVLALFVAGLVLPIAVPAAATSPPSKQVAQLKRQVAALKAKVIRLQVENKHLQANMKLDKQAHASALGREIVLKRHLAAAHRCPITRPNGSEPPGSTFGAEFHGDGSIWVGTWNSNVVVWKPEADGSIGAKFGWWRVVSGRLSIEGRRLDGPAPPLRADVPDGYGPSGFQASGIIFPSEGCWEVTGRVGNASLTFVTLVLAA
jgi:hypothetical protein